MKLHEPGLGGGREPGESEVQQVPQWRGGRWRGDGQGTERWAWRVRVGLAGTAACAAGGCGGGRAGEWSGLCFKRGHLGPSVDAAP